MASILLTCNSEDIDIALSLKSCIQHELGIQVSVHAEDDSEHADDDLDSMVAVATVLLVLEFGDSNVSAWVIIDGVDIAQSNYKESAHPEAINFSKDFAKGIEVLDEILHEDFSLNLRPAAHEQTQPFIHDYILPLKM